MFLLSLVNAWGEDNAFAYFDELSPNILQYTSSGSGPVNALLQGEAAIGLGMTAQAVMANQEGANLDIVFFHEGSPFSMYGQGIISGKEQSEIVQEVFTYLLTEYTKEGNDRFVPEQIFADGPGKMEGYPSNIPYADMSGDTIEQKEHLLSLWKY